MVIVTILSSLSDWSVSQMITFFTPFWWEHILERGRLKPDDLDETVKDLTTQ